MVAAAAGPVAEREEEEGAAAGVDCPILAAREDLLALTDVFLPFPLFRGRPPGRTWFQLPELASPVQQVLQAVEADISFALAAFAAAGFPEVPVLHLEAWQGRLS